MFLEEVKQTINKSALTCWYQPIFEIKDNELVGYEALMRCKNNSTFNPTKIFQQAKLLGEHTVLDRELIIKAQKLFGGLREYSLFINVFPSTLLEKDFLIWWDKYSENLPSVVLELSESEPISNWKALKVIVKELKERNIRIAIDDMGTGYSSPMHWIELEPEFIKLDRYYIMDIAKDIKKQRLIEGLIHMVGDPTQIILEGIEDIKALEIVKDLGICYAQGYLLGRPSPIENINTSFLL